MAKFKDSIPGIIVLGVISSLIAAYLWSRLPNGGLQHPNDSKPAPVVDVSDAFATISRIKYENNGELALVGVPNSATAYSGEAIAATATVKWDGDLGAGALKSLEVEETHFDMAGRVVYRGLILFQATAAGYVVKEENPLRGKRPLRVFETWPIGN